MKTGTLSLEELTRQLPACNELASSYVVTGDESLLVIEACDVLRKRAQELGYSEREIFHIDSRSDWSHLLGESQAISLFGNKRVFEIRIPSGKPGKVGAEAIKTLSNSFISNPNPDSLFLFVLPRLDKATQASAWFQALSRSSLQVPVPNIDRAALPRWIATRLKTQRQHTASTNLDWLADRVEGNLLAAHQEILKLGLLFPEGEITQEQIQDSVLNVARYDVFKLRDALLANAGTRVMTILEGLEAEGEALPLVLWAITEDIRALLNLAQAKQQGLSLPPLLRQWRFFGPREKLALQFLQRTQVHDLAQAMTHAHDIDKIIKGLHAKQRLNRPWHELKLLCSSLLSFQ